MPEADGHYGGYLSISWAFNLSIPWALPHGKAAGSVLRRNRGLLLVVGEPKSGSPWPPARRYSWRSWGAPPPAGTPRNAAGKGIVRRIFFLFDHAKLLNLVRPRFHRPPKNSTHPYAHHPLGEQSASRSPPLPARGGAPSPLGGVPFASGAQKKEKTTLQSLH
jgi:hypothetical protein